MQNYYQALAIVDDEVNDLQLLQGEPINQNHELMMMESPENERIGNSQLLRTSHIFEIPEKLLFLLNMTKAPADDKFEWRLPFPEVYLDFKFMLDKNPYYGLILNTVKWHEERGEYYQAGTTDSASDENVDIMITSIARIRKSSIYWKYSNHKPSTGAVDGVSMHYRLMSGGDGVRFIRDDEEFFRGLNKYEKKERNTMRSFTKNFLMMFRERNITMVNRKRTVKSHPGRSKETHSQELHLIRFKGNLKKYYDSIQSQSMGSLKSRHWVIGHWRFFRDTEYWPKSTLDLECTWVKPHVRGDRGKLIEGRHRMIKEN